MERPKINLDFYSGEDFYSDGDIEDEILDIVGTKNDFSKICQIVRRKSRSNSKYEQYRK